MSTQNNRIVRWKGHISTYNIVQRYWVLLFSLEVTEAACWHLPSHCILPYLCILYYNKIIKVEFSKLVHKWYKAFDKYLALALVWIRGFWVCLCAFVWQRYFLWGSFISTTDVPDYFTNTNSLSLLSLRALICNRASDVIISLIKR